MLNQRSQKDLRITSISRCRPFNLFATRFQHCNDVVCPLGCANKLYNFPMPVKNQECTKTNRQEKYKIGKYCATLSASFHFWRIAKYNCFTNAKKRLCNIFIDNSVLRADTENVLEYNVKNNKSVVLFSKDTLVN